MPIQIYTDGSCLGNPGPGGWAYLIEVGSKSFRGQGGEEHTTNNRMELLAVIEALKFVSTNEEFQDFTGEINIYSDSSWVVKTMTENWKRKKNLDLWAKLTPFLTGKKIKWNWVKGHAGHIQNEDCDKRALKEAIAQANKLEVSGAKTPSHFDDSPALF